MVEGCDGVLIDLERLLRIARRRRHGYGSTTTELWWTDGERDGMMREGVFRSGDACLELMFVFVGLEPRC